MAEDSEQIGGISVDIGASDANLDSALAAAEAKIKAWVKRVNATVDANLTLTVPGVSAGGGGRQQAAAAPPPFRFGASARSGAQASEETSFQRAVNAELAKRGEVMVDGVVTAMNATQRRSQQRLVRGIQQAQQVYMPASGAGGGGSAGGGAAEINATIAAVLTALPRHAAKMRKIADIISPPVAAAAAPTGAARVERRREVEEQATETGRAVVREQRAPRPRRAASDEDEGEERPRTLRRKPIRTRSHPVGEPRGDEAYTFDAATYAEQERLKEAASARSREVIISQRGARPEPAATQSEAALLTTLYPSAGRQPTAAQQRQDARARAANERATSAASLDALTAEAAASGQNNPSMATNGAPPRATPPVSAPAPTPAETASEPTATEEAVEAPVRARATRRRLPYKGRKERTYSEEEEDLGPRATISRWMNRPYQPNALVRRYQDWAARQRQEPESQGYVPPYIRVRSAIAGAMGRSAQPPVGAPALAGLPPAGTPPPSSGPAYAPLTGNNATPNAGTQPNAGGANAGTPPGGAPPRAGTPPPGSPPPRRGTPPPRGPNPAQNAQQGATLMAGDTSFDVRRAQAAFRREIERERIQRAQEQMLATQEANIQASGRTKNTMASTLGGYIGGRKKELIEAQAGLSASIKETASATRYKNVFDMKMIENEERAKTATVGMAQALRQKNQIIRQSPDYAKATKDQAEALKAEQVATERVQKLSSGFGTAARTLVAVTAAGMAFGAGLKLVDFALSAATPALANFIDIQTGFGATSTRVSTELGKQTLALKGNVNAALAMAEAQAGLSTGAADALSPQLKLTAQIKAGAMAQTQAADLFRASYGVGNAPSGLYGGYGGVGGTGLFAQQMGGGMGQSETILQNVAAMQGRGGPDLLGSLNAGLGYVTSTDVRNTVNKAANEQGNPLGAIGAIPGGAADVFSAMLPWSANSVWKGVPGRTNSSGVPYTDGSGEAAPVVESASVKAYRSQLNDAAARGQRVQGGDAASYKFTTNLNEIKQAEQSAAQAGDVYGVTLAQQYGLVLQLNGAVAASGEAYKKAAEQMAIGAGIQDPAMIGRVNLAMEKQRQLESAASVDALKSQQAFARPAAIAQIGRQQAWGMKEISAQAALANFASPLPKVGTGIKPANAAERQQMAASQGGPSGTIASQQALNAQYAVGQKIIEDTYKPAIIANFGAAAGAQFSSQLSQIQTIGAEMTSIQSSLSNKQAAYQTAQYNYQLFIARRTLSDIAGLTGSAAFGQASTLGILERQNLLLGRQAQMLSFGMSQRQINFQVATAGFAAPGTTAEARAANIKEAKIEADYAQKQLDIQRKMFGNQVQIVDIGNLRQGTDLMRQIGLLTQGRQLTFDTALAEQKLRRLSKRQELLTANVGTYMTAVSSMVSGAMSDITAWEAATGKAIYKIEVAGVAAAWAVGNAFFMGASGASLPKMQDDTLGGSSSGRHAAGGVFTTQGETSLGPYGIAGEANRETVAILRNPRLLSSGGGGGGGGGDVNFTFNNYAPVRNDGDLYAIKRMVLDVLNQKAAMQGLRGAVLS